MLKWYAETFKLTEKQMTAKALRQNWVLTGMSLFLIPAIFILEIGNLTGAALYAVRMAYYISFICLVCLTCTKFMNRFWSRAKLWWSATPARSKIMRRGRGSRPKWTSLGAKPVAVLTELLHANST